MAKQLKYQIFHDKTNEHIADIYFDSQTNEYTSELLIPTGDIPIIFGWPIAGSRPNPPSFAIEGFLKDRVIPETRQNIKELLLIHGLYEYDWRELIKLNHGRTTDDPYRIEVIQ